MAGAEEKDNVKADIEGLYGGQNDDTLDADEVAANNSASENTIYGHYGNDIIRGGSGDDYLRGELATTRSPAATVTTEMRGDAGTDTFFALDGWADYIDGGADTDTVSSRRARPRHDRRGSVANCGTGAAAAGRRARARPRAPLAKSGMFPCLRFGPGSRLVSSVCSAVMTVRPRDRGVDHVVDVAALGGTVGIRERAL